MQALKHWFFGGGQSWKHWINAEQLNAP